MTADRGARRRADPGRALEKAIAALQIGKVTARQVNDWACALFVGQQHRLTIQARDDEERERLARFATQAAEADWALPDHLVADLAVMSHDQSLMQIEVLTVEAD